MMLLRFDRSAVNTRRRLQLASTLICVRVGSAIHFLALRLCKRMRFPKVTHRFSMMHLAVPTGLSTWERAFRTVHLQSVPLKQTWNISKYQDTTMRTSGLDSLRVWATWRARPLLVPFESCAHGPPRPPCSRRPKPGPGGFKAKRLATPTKIPAAPRGAIVAPSPSELPEPFFGKPTLHVGESRKRTARLTFAGL